MQSLMINFVVNKYFCDYIEIEKVKESGMSRASAYTILIVDRHNVKLQRARVLK